MNRLTSALLAVAVTLPAAAIVASLAAPWPASAQAVPIVYGMGYGAARAALIRAGWQPLNPVGADALACGFESGSCWGKVPAGWYNLEKAHREWFRSRRMFETIHCYGTGSGNCYQLFSDVNGRELLVKTGPGGRPGIEPDVRGFQFVRPDKDGRYHGAGL
jgi:hypothetical protein